MNFIESLLTSDIRKLMYEQYISILGNSERYKYEAAALSLLATYSLNKEKNKVKGNFEDENIYELQLGLMREQCELANELKNIDEIDFEKTLEEIADVAASLTGILVKVLKIYQERNK